VSQGLLLYAIQIGHIGLHRLVKTTTLARWRKREGGQALSPF
jgi:hypothetical protein